MASADLRDELTCSICLSIYTDPVTLTCGHNFCRTCIEDAMEAKEGPGAYKCPECRAEFEERPALEKNRKLCNIAETYRSSHPEQEDVGILCTYCDSPVPAVKTCLLCETSLCEKHLTKHNKSTEHMLMEPTASLENRKCPIHKKVLEYYCLVDATCVCVSCCLIGDHWGHKMESLHEASEKKKAKMQKKLRKLISEKRKKEKKIPTLQDENRDEEDWITGLTGETTALFMGIREQLETLEKQVLSQIKRFGDKSSNFNLHQINQLEIKKEELSRKVGHIEELCNTSDPLTVLQVWESDGDDDDDENDDEDVDEYDEGKIDVDDDDEGSDDYDEENEADDKDDEDDDDEENEADDKDDEDDEENEADDKDDEDDEENEADDKDDEDDVELSDIWNSAKEEYGLIFATLHTGLDKMVTWAKSQCKAEKASVKCLNIDMTSNILLDVNTASNNTAISGDGKAMTFSNIHQKRLQGPERFKIPQVLSNKGFSAGHHYWEVEGSPSGGWRVGVTYPSIDRGGVQAAIGNNNKSWALEINTNNQYIVIHDNQSVNLPVTPSCYRLGIFLDYVWGHLSFYELGDPIRHLHTFMSSFTEPLHIAIFAGDHGWVRIRR